MEIGEVPFISHNPKPTRAEALEYYRRVSSHWELSLKLYEEIKLIEKIDNGYELKTTKGIYKTKKILFVLNLVKDIKLCKVRIFCMCFVI